MSEQPTDLGLRVENIRHAFESLAVVKVFVSPEELPGMLQCGTWEEAIIQSIALDVDRGKGVLRITCVLIDRSLCKLHMALPFITIYGMQDAQERLRLQ